MKNLTELDKAAFEESFIDVDKNNKLIGYSYFENHDKTNWKNLHSDKDFCDVTLTCADKYILTHKAIISSISPTPKEILKQSASDQLLIYITNLMEEI